MTEDAGEPGSAGPGTGERPVLGRASRALGWSFLNTAVSRLGTLGIGIVLARVLGPESFGTYAVAYVALIAVLSINELGVSLAIVRWPEDPGEIAPTVTAISLATSAVLAGLLWVAAPAFAAAMGDPGATPVVRLLGLSVLVSGAVATPAALLQRSFRQDLKMMVDQVNVWVGAVTSIVLALAGTGAMSLAVGRLAGAATSAVLFVRLSPEPYRIALERRWLRPLLRFGLPLAGASLMVFAVGYADQLIVGHVLGSSALGFYVLAFNLSSWPVTMFSQPLRSVAPAALARLQHEPEAMRATFLSIVGLVTAVAVPACLVLAGSAGPLVELVYGAQWAASAPALAWLAGLAALRILFELVYDYVVVVGASRMILAVQSVWLAASVPALWFGATTWGIAGAAAAQVAVAVLIVLPLNAYQVRRTGVALTAGLRRIALPAAAGGTVGLAAAWLARGVRPGLLALALAGAVLLAVVGWLLRRDRLALAGLRSGVSAGSAA